MISKKDLERMNELLEMTEAQNLVDMYIQAIKKSKENAVSELHFYVLDNLENNLKQLRTSDNIDDRNVNHIDLQESVYKISEVDSDE